MPTDTLDLSKLPVLMLTDAEVGHILRVGVEAVQGLHRLGKLRGHLVTGRALRWRLSDVEAFVSKLEDKD